MPHIHQHNNDAGVKPDEAKKAEQLHSRKLIGTYVHALSSM